MAVAKTGVSELRLAVRGLEEHEVGRLGRLLREARSEVGSAQAWESWCLFLVREVLPKWGALAVDGKGFEAVLALAPEGRRWQRLDMVCEGLRHGGDATRHLFRLASSHIEEWIFDAAHELSVDEAVQNETAISTFLDAWTRFPRLAGNAVDARALPAEFDLAWRRRGCRAVLKACRAFGSNNDVFFAAFATRCKLTNSCDLLARAWAEHAQEEPGLGGEGQRERDNNAEAVGPSSSDDHPDDNATGGGSDDARSSSLFAALRGSAVDGVAEALVALAAKEGGGRWSALLDATVGSRATTATRPFLKRLACGRCRRGLAPRAAAYCVRFARGDAAVFEEVASAAVALWVEPEFVRSADDERREFLTLVVLYFLKALATTHDQALKDRFVARVIPGVSAHLESTRDVDRWHAMVVAEAFATVVGQDLRFDDLDDDYRREALAFRRDLGLEDAPEEEDQDDENVVVGKKKLSDEEKIALFDESEKRAYDEEDAKRRKETKRAVRRSKNKARASSSGGRGAAAENPDDAVLSGSESDDSDSDSNDGDPNDDDDDPALSDSDESFEAYDLADAGEDLVAVAKPRYLRDLIGLLETGRDKQDARDKQLAAIECAEALIRSRPNDLRDAALTLARDLLLLPNTFDLPSFDVRCRNALVALTAAQPKEVAATLLIPQFVDGEMTVAKRIEVLDVLGAAARELAFGLERSLALDDRRRSEKNNAKNEASRRDDLQNFLASKGAKVDLLDGSDGRRVTRRRTQKQKMDDDDDDDKDDDDSNAKTRRWGYRRNAKERTTPNLFGDVAARHFFFPLLYVYLHPQKGKRVRVNSSFTGLLLCNVLNTLAVFTDCAATTPAATPFATHLLAFAWSKSQDPDPAVRKSVCVATVTALSSVPDGLRLLQRHAGTVGGLPTPAQIQAFAHDASTKDPDPAVRAITTNIARALDPRGSLLL